MASITVLGQRRVMAELDVTIERVEEMRREQLAIAARLSAAGEDASPLRTLLGLTEDYLACLRQSRAILLWELPQDPGRPGPGAVEACPAVPGVGAAG